MALSRLDLHLSPPLCWDCRNGVLCFGFGYPTSMPCGGSGNGVSRGVISRGGPRSGNREVLSRGKLKLEDAPVNGKIRSTVEIPVTCYQIIGAPVQAEKDEIVKSVMDLKRSEIEDGYTVEAIVSRQDLLMDVRDKLLFEPEYAGNFKEKVTPKSSLNIPWAWLPGALCLLQEAGEEKLVLEIGRTMLQLPDAKPYTHDLLLSMALAECSIAKAAFESNKVSQGFEALARAQYLLRSKTFFDKLPLISQIEESLEELAPACTLEMLSLPLTPENSERRSGAIAALQELLRQGLDTEACCRVQDWPAFLYQALSKLTASEIVDLLTWENIAITRKNKKSMESQNQRVVIDFNCFYLAMIAHIAFGFSKRQTDLISRAKAICECLVASEGVDMKFEDGICSLLLEQDMKAVTTERLHQLENCNSPVLRNFGPNALNKETKSRVNQSLETLLKDAILSLFPDTRNCPPSLTNFFGSQRKPFLHSKQVKDTVKTNYRNGSRSLTVNLSHDYKSFEEGLSLKSTRHLGEAVMQLAPANLQKQFTLVNDDNRTANPSSVPFKREIGAYQKNFWQNWWATGIITNKIAYAAIVGCVVFSSFTLLRMRLPYQINSGYSKAKTSALAWTINSSVSDRYAATADKKNIVEWIGKLMNIFKDHLKNSSSTAVAEDPLIADSCRNLAGTSTMLHKRQMALEDAEALVQQWQTVKAEALGPTHKTVLLSEVLSEPMLSQWQNLAKTAKIRSCFWRFVLLQMSVLRADIIESEDGEEKAKIEAVLEEAAELVDASRPKNQNYYSTYKMIYILERQLDGPWKFCGFDILDF